MDNMTEEKEKSRMATGKEEHFFHIPEGMVIIREGEVNLDMYKIIKGNVEIYSDYGTENEVLLGILGKDTCFGEFGLLLRKPAIYTIIAYSDLIVERVTEGTIGDFIQENHDSVLQIMKNMANTMMIMQHQISQLSSELDEKNKVNKQVITKSAELIRRYVYGKTKEENGK